MATTNSNFAKVGVATLSGAATLAGATTPFLEAVHPSVGVQLEVNSGGTVVDRVTHDLSLTAIPTAGVSDEPKASGKYIGGYAKNGCVLLALSGTTAQTVDMTDLTANTPASYAGDTAFAKANALVFRNLGAGAVSISTGATNPASLPAFGTTASAVTVAAGSVLTDQSNADVTVDSSHKNIVCTPAATTTLCISIGGS